MKKEIYINKVKLKMENLMEKWKNIMKMEIYHLKEYINMAIDGTGKSSIKKEN